MKTQEDISTEIKNLEKHVRKMYYFGDSNIDAIVA